MKRVALYFKRFRLKSFNYWLVIAVMALNLFGIAVVTSANENYQRLEIGGMVAGILIMLFLSLVDYNFLIRLRWVFYGLAVILLLAVIVAGDSGGGATRWIEIGSFRFQPSEIVKIMMILFFSGFFSAHEVSVSDWKIFLSSIVLIGIPLILIYKEPDLSTTIIVSLIFVALYFVAGLSYKIIGILALIGIPSAGIFFYLITRENQTILEEYQYGRVMSFIHPEQYPDQFYQQENAIIAIGSGGLLGKGLNNMDPMSVKNGNYISEPHTDFIFAIVGEELGFRGAMLLIFLLFLIVVLCIIIARKSKNLAGRLICTGVAAYIGFQSVVNMGVVTGILPNTGLPLPFVSYGLTSLISSYIAMGLVLNVSLQPNKR